VSPTININPSLKDVRMIFQINKYSLEHFIDLLITLRHYFSSPPSTQNTLKLKLVVFGA